MTSQAYQRADLITIEELGLIKKVDRQSRTRVESVLLSEGNIYAQLYLGLLKKVNRNDTQQCLLVWITDALTGRRHTCATRVQYLVLMENRARGTHTAIHQDE